MRRKRRAVLTGILFLTGLCLIFYPTVTEKWNTFRQNLAADGHEALLEELEADKLEREWERALAYNDGIRENSIYADVFAQKEEAPVKAEYPEVLNIGHDGIMGYLSIPKIDVRIPVYHGTAESVLQKGAGHLSGTKLPIGGAGNHSVLAGHRGLREAKLFTDLDQLVPGDNFYIYVLNETLAYEVDQVLPMVDPEDEGTIDRALGITEGGDYVTLFTCTPYGVNSHRLLVRGRRVPYTGESTGDGAAETMARPVGNYDSIVRIFAMAVTVMAAGVLIRVWNEHGRLRQEGKR